MINQFAGFFFYNLPCKRQIETSHVYIYTFTTSLTADLVTAGQECRSGRMRASAGGKKERVLYLLLFCCHEKVMDSLRVRVPCSCLSTNQISSPTGLILQSWDTKWEGSSPSWLDGIMCVLLWSFDRNMPLGKSGKAQQVLGKLMTLRCLSALCESEKIGNGHVFLLHVLVFCNCHLTQLCTLIQMLSSVI